MKNNKELSEILGIDLNESTPKKFGFITNPILLIIYRVYIIFALIYNIRFIDQMQSFELEFQFQLFSVVVLFFFALSVGMYRIKLDVLIEKMEAKGKPFPFKREEIGTFKRTVVIMLLIFFLAVMYFIDAWGIIKNLIRSDVAFGLNIALIISLVVGLFYTFQNPLDAIKQYFQRGIELYRNYIKSIFICVAIALCLSFIGGSSELPIMMISYNLLILYNEVALYREKQKAKKEELIS